MRVAIIAATSVVFALGCTPGARDHVGDNGDGGPGTNPDGKLATDASVVTSNSDAPLDDGSCPDNAKLVYVLGEDNSLTQFNPADKSFHQVGSGFLACDGDSPFSMAIDRNATAWVEYQSGKVYSVNTTTLACSSNATLSKPDGQTKFGMGFSTDAVAGTTETLYLGGTHLIGINPTTLMASDDGALAGAPELTGTGNAELWGFFPDNESPHIDQIDKTTGMAIKSFPLGSHLAGMPNAYAFAFWGGSFWVFLYRDPGDDDLRFAPHDSEFYSVVYEVDATTGMVKNPTNPIDTGGLKISGAGVSTCAPTVLQ